MLTGKKRGRKPGLNSNVVQRNAANARERSRMRVLSTAFVELKGALPWVPKDTKLSKLDTLKLAAGYISYLKQVLESSGDSMASTSLSADSHSLFLEAGTAFYEESLLENLLWESVGRQSVVGEEPDKHKDPANSCLNDYRSDKMPAEDPSRSAYRQKFGRNWQQQQKTFEEYGFITPLNQKIAREEDSPEPNHPWDTCEIPHYVQPEISAKLPINYLRVEQRNNPVSHIDSTLNIHFSDPQSAINFHDVS